MGIVSKVYRYQLAPNRWDEFIQLQQKGDAIYSRHVAYKVSFVRDQTNPQLVAEIHEYPDIEAARKADSLNQIEPELQKLFEQFVRLLDPSNNKIDELIGETFLIRE